MVRRSLCFSSRAAQQRVEALWDKEPMSIDIQKYMMVQSAAEQIKKMPKKMPKMKIERYLTPLREEAQEKYWHQIGLDITRLTISSDPLPPGHSPRTHNELQHLVILGSLASEKGKSVLRIPYQAAEAIATPDGGPGRSSATCHTVAGGGTAPKPVQSQPPSRLRSPIRNQTRSPTDHKPDFKPGRKPGQKDLKQSNKESSALEEEDARLLLLWNAQGEVAGLVFGLPTV
ncbi:hypothetical protein F5Y17DRAFT_459897 [Xylariaceae sp. FL0594]|nr:hypothetical protein F5Y17DRAFT_459897 [Xylariaceae sp. FL0594]